MAQNRPSALKQRVSDNLQPAFILKLTLTLSSVVAGLFVLIIPFLQLKGSALRHNFSIKKKPRAIANTQEKVDK